MTTLREALTNATGILARNENLRDSASRDAELLLLHALQAPRTILFSDPSRILSEEAESLFGMAIQRRLQNEPIQYITGTQEFYGLAFQVTPAVLIPRPETELLVESVLKLLPSDRPLRIADVGTGSGILAVTLALHLPQAQLTALDISPEALAVASRNAELHGVADRIRFVESDLLAAVAGESVAGVNFDAILSNPPYIPLSDLPTLHPQVRDHEPHMALFGGTAGLDLYARLIPQAHWALVPDGLLALEIGYGQQPALHEMLAQWKDLCFLKDLNGVFRTVSARRP